MLSIDPTEWGPSEGTSRNKAESWSWETHTVIVDTHASLKNNKKSIDQLMIECHIKIFLHKKSKLNQVFTKKDTVFIWEFKIFSNFLNASLKSIFSDRVASTCWPCWTNTQQGRQFYLPCWWRLSECHGFMVRLVLNVTMSITPPPEPISYHQTSGSRWSWSLSQLLWGKVKFTSWTLNRVKLRQTRAYTHTPVRLLLSPH